MGEIPAEGNGTQRSWQLEQALFVCEPKESPEIGPEGVQRALGLSFGVSGCHTGVVLGEIGAKSG
jgi:hypothetical protein